MNSIKLTIQIKAIDCYIYSGHVFFILQTGELAFTSFDKVLGKLQKSTDEYRFLKIIFERNDLYERNELAALMEVSDFKDAFDKSWDRLCKKDHINIDLKLEDLEILNLGEAFPVLDMKIYLMNILLGTRNGLFSIKLTPSKDKLNIFDNKFNKKFDSKVVFISPRAGEVFLSCKNDGLFKSNYFVYDNLIIEERQIENKSIRTGWQSYNFFNYINSYDAKFLINKVVKNIDKENNKEEKINYRISEIGIEKYNLEDFLQNNHTIKISDVSYSFNNNDLCYFILKDGSIYSIAVKYKNKRLNLISLDKPIYALNVNGKANFKPISTQILLNGYAIEYFDKVVINVNFKTYEIENEPAITIRSFNASKRYKSLLAVVKENSVNIHSVYPFMQASGILPQSS